MWKVAIVVYFNVLSLDLPATTEENNENSHWR